MTASVVEVITGTATASSSNNYSVTTTLVSSDLVVIAWSRGTTGSATLSGLGGTWTAVFDETSGNRVMARYTTGVTGTGTVTLNPGSGSTGNVVIYVVRGLTSPSTWTSAQSTWSSGTTGSNTDEGNAGIAYGTDQFVMAFGTAITGTITFPSNPTPSIGSWTVDSFVTTNAEFYNASFIGTSSGSAVMNIRSTSTTTLGVAVFVFGTASGPAPLTSTFVGWGNPIF